MVTGLPSLTSYDIEAVERRLECFDPQQMTLYSANDRCPGSLDIRHDANDATLMHALSTSLIINKRTRLKTLQDVALNII